MTEQRFTSTRSRVVLSIDTDADDEYATFGALYRDDAAVTDMDAKQVAAIVRQLTDWLAERATRTREG